MSSYIVLRFSSISDLTSIRYHTSCLDDDSVSETLSDDINVFVFRKCSYCLSMVQRQVEFLVRYT